MDSEVQGTDSDIGHGVKVKSAADYAASTLFLILQTHVRCAHVNEWREINTEKIINPAFDFDSTMIRDHRKHDTPNVLSQNKTEHTTGFDL